MNIPKITADVSLKPYNTFGIDVKAHWFCQINSVEELQNVLQNTDYQDVKKLILGGGSNILLTQDFDGLVLWIQIQGMDLVKETENCTFLRFGAGVNWHQAVLFAIKQNLGGIENLSLIPGTVGAAPIQNIGAYGVELKDVFESLEALEIDTGTLKIFDKNACQFSYRNSIFKQESKGKFIITSVVLKLQKKPTFQISYGAIRSLLAEKELELSPKNISDVVIQIRESKLPDPAKIGNSGSFFKNPEIPKAQFEALKMQFPDIIGYPVSVEKTKVPAGWLIEQTGIKGRRFGNTGTYEKQALVLVNYGEATGEEILHFSKKIQNRVSEKFGIFLEPEVNLI